MIWILATVAAGAGVLVTVTPAEAQGSLADCPASLDLNWGDEIPGPLTSCISQRGDCRLIPEVELTVDRSARTAVVNFDPAPTEYQVVEQGVDFGWYYDWVYAVDFGIDDVGIQLGAQRPADGPGASEFHHTYEEFLGPDLIVAFYDENREATSECGGFVAYEIDFTLDGSDPAEGLDLDCQDSDLESDFRTYVEGNITDDGIVSLDGAPASVRDYVGSCLPALPSLELADGSTVDVTIETVSAVQGGVGVLRILIGGGIALASVLAAALTATKKGWLRKGYRGFMRWPPWRAQRPQQQRPPGKPKTPDAEKQTSPEATRQGKRNSDDAHKNRPHPDDERGNWFDTKA